MAVGKILKVKNEPLVRTLGIAASMKIRLRNLRTIEGRYDVARGHPGKPLSWPELAEKFHECAPLGLPLKNAEAAIVSRLEQLQSLSPLLGALSGSNRITKPKPQNHGAKSGALFASDSEISPRA